MTTTYPLILAGITQLLEAAGPTPARASLNLDAARLEDRELHTSDYVLALHTPFVPDEVDADALIAYAMQLQPDVSRWRLREVNGFYIADLGIIEHDNGTSGEVKVFLHPRTAYAFELHGAIADPDKLLPSEWLSRLVPISTEGAAS